MSAPEKCPEKVWHGGDWNGGFGPCGKPVKREGRCGVHANVQERREAEKARRNEARETVAAAERMARELTEATAIPFAYNGQGSVTLAPAAAENLLRTYFGRKP